MDSPATAPQIMPEGAVKQAPVNFQTKMQDFATTLADKKMTEIQAIADDENRPSHERFAAKRLVTEFDAIGRAVPPVVPVPA